MILLFAFIGILLALLAICVFRAVRQTNIQSPESEVSVSRLRDILQKGQSATTVGLPENFDRRTAQYAAGLRSLLQAETVSSVQSEISEKFDRFHQVMAETFPLLHKNCEKYDFDGSLLFHWKGKSAQNPILLMNHLDVVEAVGAWKHAPFAGEIADGRIYGRGALDDKGPLYVMYQAVEELLAEGFVPPCDVYLASSCTEEIGGTGAGKTAKWLQEKGIRLRFLLDEGGMLVDRPMTGVDGIYAMIGVLEKGIGNVKFIAKSSGGHASAPPNNTPLVRLGRLMSALEDNYPFRMELPRPLLEMLRRLTPNVPFAFRLVTANLWLFQPLLKVLVTKVPMLAAMSRTTVAFTTAKGSDGYNVLPQEAFVTANIRYSHHQAVEETHRILHDFAKKYDIETEILNAEEPAPVVDYGSAEFRLVEETIQTVYPGVQVSPYVMTGGTDARFYKDLTASALRFAPLYITADQLARVHGVDESLFIYTLAFGVDFYKKLLERL